MPHLGQKLKESITVLFIALWLPKSVTMEEGYKVSKLDTGTKSHLVAISTLGPDVAWISGRNATLLRTVDGGDTWEAYQNPGVSNTLQYRDVHAFDVDTVAAMSAGQGNESQIHLFNAKTQTWTVLFVMDNPNGFLDSISFWGARGLAYGDSVNAGKPYVLTTEDQGRSWAQINPQSMPDSVNDGEGGFASSGSCIAVQEGGVAWIGTGSNGNARILKTTDHGSTWTSYQTPIVKGDAAGITSVHFWNKTLGMITGGDLNDSESNGHNRIAFTENGGITWTQVSGTPKTQGPFYGGDVSIANNKVRALVCGPKGVDISLDGGSSWEKLSEDNIWVVQFSGENRAWMAGWDGTVLRLDFT